MYVDKLLEFSDAQAVTAAAASTNVVDFSVARDLGNGRPLYLVLGCVVAMTDAGSDSTLAVAIQTDSDEAFGTAVTLGTVHTFAATTAANTQVVIPLSIGWAYDRYVRLYYTPANGNLTTGSFDAFLAFEGYSQKVYGSGFSVS